MLKDWEAEEELGEHRAAQKPRLGKHKEPLGLGSGAAAPALGKRPRFHPSSRQKVPAGRKNRRQESDAFSILRQKSRERLCFGQRFEAVLTNTITPQRADVVGHSSPHSDKSRALIGW